MSHAVGEHFKDPNTAEAIFARDAGGVSSGQFSQLFDRVERIARGEITLVESAADIRLRLPDEPNIEAARRKDQEAMRAAAEVIYKWYKHAAGIEGSGHSPRAGGAL